MDMSKARQGWRKVHTMNNFELTTIIVIDLIYLLWFTNFGVGRIIDQLYEIDLIQLISNDLM